MGAIVKARIPPLIWLPAHIRLPHFYALIPVNFVPHGRFRSRHFKELFRPVISWLPAHSHKIPFLLLPPFWVPLKAFPTSFTILIHGFCTDSLGRNSNARFLTFSFSWHVSIAVKGCVYPHAAMGLWRW